MAVFGQADSTVFTTTAVVQQKNCLNFDVAIKALFTMVIDSRVDNSRTKIFSLQLAKAILQMCFTISKWNILISRGKDLKTTRFPRVLSTKHIGKI